MLRQKLDKSTAEHLLKDTPLASQSGFVFVDFVWYYGNMTEKEVKNAIKYWTEISIDDYEVMISLFKNKYYSNALFFGHIVLEKLMKGFYVKQKKERAPYTHDLVFLNDKLDSILSTQERKFLYEVNKFNIRARYPDFKLKFYKECTKEYTEKNLEKIKIIYEKLWKELK